MKPTIVVSAINFFEGGPLTILKECLDYLSANISGEYRVIALVHDVKLFQIEGVEFIEYKKSRKSWFCRIYYEYVHFFFLSRKLKPHLWLSLHDITPNVKADVRAVYCHNPSPFYSFSLRTLLYSFKVAMFSLLYKYLYRVNIHKNNFVVVQQKWIRDAFNQMYGTRNVIVSYPNIPNVTVPEIKADPCGKVSFLYPAFPRVFKNFEVVAEAARLLYEEGRTDFDVLLTISGKENVYARKITAKYKDNPTISFIGLKTREEIYTLYGQGGCLIFSSLLETWGLPITEAKQFQLPLILADLPYARETVGCYDKVSFFNPNDPAELAEQMKSFIDGRLVFEGSQAVNVADPFANNWNELFDILLSQGRAANA